MNRRFLPGGIIVVAGLWLALAGGAHAQRPEEIPGLEDIDSIPAASGFRTSAHRTVFIDSAGVRSDSAVKERRRYDERGRIVEIKGYDDAGEELYRQSYLYDRSSGLVMRSWKLVTEYQSITSDWWYLHDPQGRIMHAEDSISKVAIRYSYGDRKNGGPCIAIGVDGRYRFSGIDSYCDSSGRITRQIGYIDQIDTVIALVEYPTADSRRRTVHTDGGQRCASGSIAMTARVA